jgi:hypothetical protein
VTVEEPQPDSANDVRPAMLYNWKRVVPVVRTEANHSNNGNFTIDREKGICENEIVIPKSTSKATEFGISRNNLIEANVTSEGHDVPSCGDTQSDVLEAMVYDVTEDLEEDWIPYQAEVKQSDLIDPSIASLVIESQKNEQVENEELDDEDIDRLLSMYH